MNLVLFRLKLEEYFDDVCFDDDLGNSDDDLYDDEDDENGKSLSTCDRGEGVACNWKVFHTTF